ncbi:hypothetical protein V8G54_001395, partial [Vigna mungo]
RPRCCQLSNHVSSDHLALPSGHIDSEAGSPRRSRRREEGAGEGKNLEAAVERDDSASSGRLAEADIGDGAAAAEDADPALAAARVGGDAVEYVGAASDLEDVRSESVGALPRDYHRRLRLVLGSRWPSTWTATDHITRTRGS